MVTAARTGALPHTRIEQLFSRGVEEIGLALQPFGFYRPTIQSRLDTSGSPWRATYEVDPGPPLLLSRVDVRVVGEGEGDDVVQHSVAVFPLAPDDTLRHALYEQGKLALARVVAERGYLDAAFDTAQIRIDREAYSSEIVLHMTTGTRYSFGPVTFEQDVVDESQLQGYVTFQPGDDFELSKLLELQRGLSSSPFFSQVEVRPVQDDVDGRNVPIAVSAVPRKRQRYEIGFGYGTDTGFRGTVEVGFRRINRKGHNATARLEISQIRRNISGQYRFPPSYPETANYALSVNAGDISPTWSSTLRLAFGASRSQLLGPIRQVLSTSYDLQDFTVAAQDGTSNLLIFGASHSWTHADDRLITLTGSQIQLNARGSLDAVASSATFLQLILRGKLIKGVVGNLRFLGRAELGTTFTSQFLNLPPTIRFVTGGDRTVRGYSYESLGPRGPQDQIVGGDALIAASTEFDFPIAEKWRVATFLDAGNALAWGGPFSLVSGAGVGGRWVSPVGMVRVDVAYGFEEPSRGIRLHLTFGPDI